MATVIVTGNAKVEQEREEEFVAKVGDAVTSALGLPSNLKSIHFYPVPDSRFTKKDKPELTFFVYTAPDKTTEQKRVLVKNVAGAVDAFFGAGEVTSVVIVKIHEDQNVGVNGVLRLDAKAAAAGK